MIVAKIDKWFSDVSRGTRFVLGASIEMPRGIRVNAVSPEVVEESMEKIGSFFRGHIPVPVSKVALAYSKSVEGCLTGQVFPAH